LPDEAISSLARVGRNACGMTGYVKILLIQKTSFEVPRTMTVRGTSLIFGKLIHKYGRYRLKCGCQHAFVNCEWLCRLHPKGQYL
jgi:hypothetical protein